MTPSMTLVYIVIALICGTIASLIGRPKGYPVWGFFMGTGLGIIGIAVITLWPAKHLKDGS